MKLCDHCRFGWPFCFLVQLRKQPDEVIIITIIIINVPIKVTLKVIRCRGTLQIEHRIL